MNGIIWTDDENEVFLRVGDVFTVHIFGPEGKNGIETDIPADVYLDRYTADWRETSNQLKTEIRKKREEIVNLEVSTEKLTTFHRRNIRDLDSNGKGYSPKTLLELTISHFEAPVTKTETDDDIAMDSQPVVDPTAPLKELLVKLEQKLIGIFAAFHLVTRN
jgi:hypothetical protein